MPALTTIGIATPGWTRRAFTILALWFRHLDRTLRNRRVARELARCDDRMLADIGLSRADLRDAYAESIWSDPTTLLRARAIERRLARRGISNGFKFDRMNAPPLVPKIDTMAVSQARATFSNCG